MNNLALNTTKIKKIILDFRKHSADPAPLFINGVCMEKVQTFKFLGTVISADVSRSCNTTGSSRRHNSTYRVLPQSAQGKHPQPGVACALLPLCREPAAVLQLSVVGQLHWSRQKGSSESYQHSTKDQRLFSPVPKGHFHHLLSKQSWKHYGGQLTAPALTCLKCSPLEDATGLLEHRQTDLGTVSSPEPSMHWILTCADVWSSL